MNRFRTLSFLSLAAALAPSSDAATISVKKGGAHPTITSGIAAAAAGDVVKIEAGVYQENLEVASGLTGLTLRAHGKVVVEARLVGGAAGGPGIAVFADAVTVEGITVRNADGIDSDHPGVGILVEANGFTARDVSTQRCLDDAVRVTGDDVLIERWSDFGSRSGLAAQNGQHAIVRDCLLRQENGAAMTFNGWNDALVENCRFILLEGTGISASDAANVGIVVRGNRFDQTLDFAIVVGGTDGVVEENTITDSDAGILVRGDGFSVRANRLRRIYGFVGIFVDESTSGTIEDNELVDIRSTGIDVRDTVTGTSVKNNVLRGLLSVDDPAIEILGANVEVDGNQIKDCVGDGIAIEGDSNFVANNVIEDCLRDGIDVESSAAANTISNCTIRRCLAEGLDHSGTVSIVADNTIEDCRIDVANDGSFINFTGNTFTTGGQATAPEID